MSTHRQIRLTNTLTGKKEILETTVPGKLTMYSCGPTVYNFIHIGNLRGALVSDMFFRYFKRVGYDVVYVRNYTDVDDKIIQKATDEKTTSEAVAHKYTREVETDFAMAGILEPTHKTTVTTHIAEIINLVKRIIDNGKAYVIDSGEVLFSIESFPEYGKLSHKPIDDLIAGIRVNINEKKRNPLDFSLWKPAKPGEPAWDSPWGKGRPGWHIECSAMAGKWLGDQIDVHHGGEDLIFPHHENEIAQSEAATGKAPFVKYWLHHAFLTMSKEKMSKSVGNVFLARDFLTQFSGELARFLLLSSHYRSPIDFTDDLVEQAITGLNRIYEAKAKAIKLFKQTTGNKQVTAPWDNFVMDCERAKKEIDDALANDFNISAGLGSLFTLIREFNRIVALNSSQSNDQKKDNDKANAAAIGAGKLIQLIEEDIGDIIGIGKMDPEKAFEDLKRIHASRLAASGVERLTEDEILRKIDERKEARKAKDFAKADLLRKELDSKGVIINDSPSGTTWEYK